MFLLWGQVHTTTNYPALRGKQSTFVVGPDFSVVGSDSAAELAGEMAPLQPQLHPLQLIPQRAHAPRIVTQHTQNLPALPLSIITILPLSILKILPLSIALALPPAYSQSPCIATQMFMKIPTLPLSILRFSLQRHSHAQKVPALPLSKHRISLHCHSECSGISTHHTENIAQRQITV